MEHAIRSGPCYALTRKADQACTKVSVLLRGLLFVVLLSVVPHAAFALPKEEAAQHFAQGMDLVADGRVKQALDEFQRAYSLLPHYAVLYNIGQAHSDLGQPLQALKAFRRYLEDGQEQISARRRAHVEQKLAELEASVAEVTVRSSASDARVHIDGALVGQLPLKQPIRVNPGVHRVKVYAAERDPAIKTVSVAPGEHAQVMLDPPPRPSKIQTRLLGNPTTDRSVTRDQGLQTRLPGSPTTNRSVTRDQGLASSWQQAQRPMAWGLGAAGLVALAVGAAYGLDSLNKANESDALCEADDSNPVSCPDTSDGRRGYQLNQDALDARDTAITGYVIGGVLLAGGCALWLTAPRELQQSRAGDIRASFALGRRQQSFLLQGVWE
jgi:hypothetical protein